MVGDGMWGRDGRGVRSAKYQEVECGGSQKRQVSESPIFDFEIWTLPLYAKLCRVLQSGRSCEERKHQRIFDHVILFNTAKK